ncbi:MAG TPA: YciI family protein [Variovorax sp.]|nr:YciI family protein [Variovorax sp.]
MSQVLNSDRRRLTLAAGGLVGLQALIACGGGDDDAIATAPVPAPAPAESRLYALLIDIVDPSKFEAVLPAHAAWLDNKFKQGVFLVTGGFEGVPKAFAMFHAANQAAAEAVMADEPFRLAGVAKQEILDYNPRFINAGFAPVAKYAGASTTTEFVAPIAPGNLYVMLIDIIAPQPEFEKLLPKHIPWLESKFKLGVFAGSGGLGPGPRALAFVKAPSVATAQAWLAEDPLVIDAAVTQQLLQFTPRFHAPAFTAVVAGTPSVEVQPK